MKDYNAKSLSGTSREIYWKSSTDAFSKSWNKTLKGNKLRLLISNLFVTKNILNT